MEETKTEWLSEDKKNWVIKVPRWTSNAFIKFRTDETVESVFHAIRKISVCNEEGQETVLMTGQQWGIYLLMKNESIWHNQMQGFIYASVPSMFFRKDTVCLRLEFQHLLKEDETLQLILAPQDAAMVETWKFSKPLAFDFTSDQKEQLIMDLTSLVQPLHRIAQIVFYPVSGSPSAIFAGGLLSLNSKVIRRFENAFEFMVLDKALFNIQVPKKNFFTITFENWLSTNPLHSLSALKTERIENLSLELFYGKDPLQKKTIHYHYEFFVVYH